MVYDYRTGDNYKQWYYFESLSAAEAAASAFATSTAYTYTGITVSNVSGSNYNVVNGLKIQDAINAVATSGTITVASGTYAETLQINKALTLNGAQAGVNATNSRSGGESIIVSNSADGTIQIAPTSTISGTVEINGFQIGTATTSPYKAIHVMHQTSQVNVENNIIEPSDYDGINLYSAVAGTVDQNLVLGAATSGITMGNDSAGIITSSTITNNKVENSKYGITGYATGSVISDNEVVGTDSLTEGSGIGGNFYNTSITDNTVSGYSAGAGIAFQNPYSTSVQADSSGVTVSGNEVYGNGYNFYAVSDSSAAMTTVSGNYFESPVGTNTLVLNTLASGYSFSGNYYSNWSGTGNYAISGTDDGTTVSTTSSAFVDTSPMVRPVYVATTGTDSPTYGTEANPYKTIQYAVDHVTPGGKVYAEAGTYSESPNITKPVTLQSTGGRDTTTIVLQSGPTYTGSLTVATSDVTISGFTIQGFDAAGSGLASSNIYLESGVSNVTVSNNKIEVGQVGSDANGDDGIGFLTTYNTTDIGDNINVTGNIFQPVGSSAGGFRAFYVNPGVNHFTFSGNTITGNFVHGSITQAQNGLIRNNTVTGAGSTSSRSAGLGTWGYPDPTVWGHTTFSGNTISGTANAIAVYETNDVIINGNTLSGNGTGVWVGNSTPLLFDVTTISINNNNLSGEDNFGVNNTIATTTLDATNNYWGTVSSTTIASMVSSGVTYTPWSGGLQSDTTVDADAPEILVGTDATSTTSTVNVPQDVTNATLNASALLDTTDHSVTLPGAITVNATTSVGNVNVQIPAGIKITGTSGWTGTINVPQVKDNSFALLPSERGFNDTVNSVIEVGYGDVKLTFDKAVRILIAGQAGKSAGYTRGGVFTAITNSCTIDSQSWANTNLPAEGDCSTSVGSDLVIWTKHFTNFVTYNRTVIPDTIISSGGGGGGGYVAPATTVAPASTVTPTTPAVTTPVGQVLGATAFQFTSDLELGAQSDAVTELQNRLTSEGVYSGPVTGYFGQLTLAGVKAYQAKYGLPKTGLVGPMTREKLNAALESGQVLGASTTGTAQTVARIQGIISELQAQGGQEKVISVLQMVLAFLGQ